MTLVDHWRLRQRPNARGDQPQLLHEVFERQAARRPRHPAVECNGQMLTYAELDAQANRIARLLHARGVTPGALVGLYFEKSCMAFAAMLGILKAGAGYAPIDPKTPVARIGAIVEDGAIAVILSEGHLGANLPPFAGSTTILLDRAAAELRHYADNALTSDESGVTLVDTCYVIFTSGSTGKPKGVVIEHRHAVNFVSSLATIYKVRESDRIYQGFSLAFDASVEEIWAAFSRGATLVVPTESIARSPSDAADFIAAQRITYFSTVPSFLAMIEANLPAVRLLVVGGEDCPAELVSRWAAGRRMLNTYGPTEATVVATAAECVPGKPVTIGNALPGYTTYVLDVKLNPVAPGEVGELFIGGESVARGYLHRHDLTNERFIANPFDDGSAGNARLYRTHDLVRLMDDGVLQFVGRNDTLVKIRGFRVELAEIESVLIEQPGIRAAAVAVQTDGGIQEIAAFVITADGVEIDGTAVAQALRQRLPEYMMPKYIDPIEELPRLTSGKIDRGRLPAGRTLLAGNRRERAVAQSPCEAALVEVYQHCFRIDPIYVTDDFFTDLGGHSLIAARVVSELRKRFNTGRIAVRDIYEHRTIRDFVAHLEKNEIIAAHQNECAPESGVEAQASGWDEVSRAGRWLCASMQAVALVAYHGLVAAPAITMVLLVVMVVDGDMRLWRAMEIGTALGFAVWPSWLLVSIALKWLVIGRYKPGKYPVWGAYYFRWWLVNRFQALSWSGMFVGTPLMSLYYRAMGAKVGRDCTIATPLCTAFDLVSIGEGSSIGAETQLLGYRVENGWLIIDKVTIGRNCFVGAHSNLALNVAMGDGARLDEMSLLADGEAIPAGEGRCGSPARAALVATPGDRTPRGRTRGRFLFGLLHLGLIYVMGYLLILSALPSAALVFYALTRSGAGMAALAALAAVPLMSLSYLAIAVIVKHLFIGRIRPGAYRQNSVGYLRLWFQNFLLENMRHLLLPAYATLAMPVILRLLGARIGKGVEVSTVMQITPDLLDVGDGSFLADACIVGGQRIHNGLVEVLPNRIGERTFIGNSAHLRGGVDAGDDALIGVLSTAPADVVYVRDNTRWLGSPSFELPGTQAVSCVASSQTYAPTRGLIAMRLAMELVRILLPALIAGASLVAFAFALVFAYRGLPLWQVIALSPVIAVVLGLSAVLASAGVKKALIGTFTPVMKPLWTPYIWANEVVNGVYESTAAIAMAPLMGTPFLAPCLRLMGCKIGSWAFLETTLFSEFDLVEIGDRAALNLGATVQTHLFEDRVMKSDHLKIGDGCSIGNMSVMLYGAEMQPGACIGPLSLIMKGESLPSGSRWYGIPTQLMKAGSDPQTISPPLAAEAA